MIRQAAEHGMQLKREDLPEHEHALAKVQIVGDRYPAEQQRQVQKS